MLLSIANKALYPTLIPKQMEVLSTFKWRSWLCVTYMLFST